MKGGAGKRPSYLEGSKKTVSKEKPVEQPKREKEDREIAAWSVWLLPRRPLVAVIVVGTLFLCFGLAYWAVPSFLFLAAVMAILLNRLAAYLFPTRYFLNENTVGYRTFLGKDVRNWSQLFTYYEYPDGVLLCLDTGTVRGRMGEGLFLYYSAGNQNEDEVLSEVKKRLKPPDRAKAAKKKQFGGGIRSAWRRVRGLGKDKS